MFSVSVPSCHKHKIRPAADFAIKPMPGFLRIICIFLVIIFCQYVSSTDLDVVLQRTVEELLANTVVDETAISGWISSISSVGNWSDVVYSQGCAALRANWTAMLHLQRIEQLAASWLNPQSSWYQNQTVLNTALSALAYWIHNDYNNTACTAGNNTNCPCNTPGLWNPNWWFNQIGAPQVVGPECLLLSNSSLFTSFYAAGCEKILNRASLAGETGANTLWQAQVIFYNGLLRANDTYLDTAFTASNDQLMFTNQSQDGLKVDGSFLQHNGVLYNGGYGNSFVTVYLQLFLPTAGIASYTANDAEKAALSTLLLDGDQWMMAYVDEKLAPQYVTVWDINVIGRQLVRPTNQQMLLDINAILNLTAGWPREKEFLAWADIVTSTSTLSPSGNKVFWKTDMVVHRRTSYFVSLRGYSARTLNTECVNAENPLGLHLADGAMYVYKSGYEYYDIEAFWDWNHIPGITVDYGAVVLECSHVSTRTTKTFVGGVSDGNNGVWTLDFVGAYGSMLSFKKSYFFFDQQFAVLITDINCSSSFPVHHVLDSRFHNGNAYVSSASSSSGVEISGNSSSGSVWWLHHDEIGYIFPGNLGSAPQNQLVWNVGQVSGNWSSINPVGSNETIFADLATFWLESQNAPVSADSLSYIVAPNISYSDFTANANNIASNVIAIIENTPSVQAVFHSQQQLLGVVFWTGGFFLYPSLSLTFSSGAPCSVLISFDGSTPVALNVADPTQQLRNLLFTVNRSLTCSVCTPNGTSGTTISVTLPSGEFAGSSVTITLQTVNSM